MTHPISNRVREALLMAALFGGVGVAWAQAPASDSGNVQSAEHKAAAAAPRRRPWRLRRRRAQRPECPGR
jgi:hypothetical protein